MLKFQSSRRLWIAIAMVLLLLLMASQVSAASDRLGVMASSPPAADEPVAIVTAGALNVRTGPDYTYRSIAVIYQGQYVSMLGRWATNNWVLVRLWNGTEGWVNSVYLQTGVPISQLPVIGGVPPSTPTPDQPVAGPAAVINTGALNVRSGPGLNYTSVAVVTSGQTVLLIGRNASATWAKVQIPNGVQGWVNVYYIQTSASIASLPVVDAPADTGQAIGTVNTGAVNVRTGPGAQFNSIAVLSSGTTVALVGRNADGTWVRIRLGNGQEGWVNASYLQTNVPIQSLAIVESPLPQNAAVVNVGALNVRYGPGTGYGVFAVIFRGQVVSLVGRASYGTWAQVRLPNGALGWVNSNLLISNVDYNSLPVTGP